MFLKVLTVAGLATFEIYAAIPGGFAFGLPPLIIFAATAIGGLAGVFIAFFLGEKIRKMIYRKKPVGAKPIKDTLAHRLWKKYGLFGLGFVGTMTVGAPLSIAAGTGLNANLSKLLTWCCIGVVVRSLLFTTIGHYSLQLL
jgi:membrane protein YqaA with SNARE-associated domain